MSVELLAIRFNCEPGQPGITGLNLRRNARELISIPEWTAGGDPDPGQSPAAYATANSWARPVLIQARLARTRPGVDAVQVRAIPDTPLRAQLQGWESLYASHTMSPLSPERLAWYRALTSLDHVLGEIEPRWVLFPPSGDSGFLTFVLPGHHLWNVGVGIHAVHWRWQFRFSPAQPWQDFVITRHRIFTVLNLPQTPWQLFPFIPTNTQLPWTDVLEYACLWAAGARTRTAAAEAITRAVFNLGPALIEYGCPIFALTQYALIYFECSAFLERLSGGYGNGPYVNCTDCATIVSTFANAIGCDLWQSRMGPAMGQFFFTNPIRVIGSSLWGPPCGIAAGFQYHEVAWAGNCGPGDPVSDACLLVNGNFHPALPPYLPLLPASMPFAPGLGGYRDRLASPGTQFNCIPLPLTRQRRAII
jgi:hypothetical protein